MSHDRRSFLRLSTLAGGALAAGALGGRPEAARSRPEPPFPDIEPAPRSLRILILGGTGFIGPYQVAYAVARGHRVTVFNRGRSEADLAPGVEALVGDRNTGDLDALRGREWDAVIDNPTTLPFWVRDAAEILEAATDQYVFISTLSAYDVRGVSRIDEETPTLEFQDGDPLEVGPDDYSGALYGPMKAESEREALRWYGGRTTVIRPGLIVGPGDQTDRFTYWPVRIRRGGEIVAPGDGHDPVQIVDARDLSEWIVRTVEDGTTGVFNATGPRAPLSMAEQLYGIRAALPGDLELAFRWVAADVLREHGVQAWSEMTTWFGPDSPLPRTSIERAVGAGLTFRPLADTVRDTLAWWDALPADRRATMRAGLDPEKERGVLAAG
jgi:2'-hydroxyisoflavone reductase